jgi:hypothetical protein
MSLTFSMDLFGDTVISRKLMRVGANSEDYSPAFREIADVWENWTGEQFHTRGSFMGTPWAPLRPATIAHKRRVGAADPTQPLVTTGWLADSLFGSGADGIRDFGPHEMAWGTQVPYGRWQHRTRPIFRLDEMRRRATMRMLHEHTFRPWTEAA